MIKSKSELKKTIYLEKSIYQQYMFQTCVRRIFACIKREPAWLILKWQILSRTVDYYNYRLKHSPSIIEKVKYLYFIRKRNILGARLGLEIGTENIAPGLLVYHFAGGCVVNGGVLLEKTVICMETTVLVTLVRMICDVQLLAITLWSELVQKL